MRKAFEALAILLSYSSRVQNARSIIILSVVTGAISGVGSATLIAVINAVVGGTPIHFPLGWTFLVLCFLIPAAGYCSEVLLVRLTAGAAHDLRIQLSQRILSAPYSLLEEIGAHRLLAIITEDTRTLTEVVSILPLSITQLAILTGCLVYLGWLSWLLLLVMLAYMLVGTITYQLPLQRAMRYFKLAREEWDHTFKAIRGITEGAKELKLNRDRREAFFSRQLEPPIAGIRSNEILGNALAAVSRKGGQILFFVFIGIVLFVTPRFLKVDHQISTGYVLTVLFMIAPFSIILGTLPSFGRAHIAAEKIRSLGLSLSHQPSEALSSGGTPAFPASSTDWRRLDLVDVMHVYRHEGAADEFCLGPLNLTFYPGQLVFLIGGNGSGKTTLAKLLIGLYEPSKGEICLDDKPITRENRDEYRQHFSVVFYDFYLFDKLLGIKHADLDARSTNYLVQLQLDHKVTVAGGELSTLELSQGQRKRLALLTAYLEDRPIYIFDEWASDQDPLFKEVFYHQILPELKARGKTVIVVTHDDRYYHVADRIIKVDQGQVEYDKSSLNATEVKDIPASIT
jgi:putative pyoverdin transport system ATP-binding/permease protein